jgi:hypothetical protein
MPQGFGGSPLHVCLELQRRVPVGGDLGIRAGPCTCRLASAIGRCDSGGGEQLAQVAGLDLRVK